jgi:2-polyprenyl-3-methyl-5-hydroxy-6-metoxy-1,4-benzoquinol methylase
VTDPAPGTRRALWDERHATHEPIESAAPDPTLAEVAAALPGGRALDLAAGDGRNAIWLAAHGWTVTAVDFSAVALERAGRTAAAAAVEVEWVNADLLEWSAEPASFDLVALMFLHLPAEERRPIYAAAARAVAPGGRLLVVAHDRANLTEGVGGPQDPAVLFTASEVAAELDGLTVERTDTVARDVGGERPALDAVLVAVRPIA